MVNPVNSSHTFNPDFIVQPAIDELQLFLQHKISVDDLLKYLENSKNSSELAAAMDAMGYNPKTPSGQKTIDSLERALEDYEKTGKSYDLTDAVQQIDDIAQDLGYSAYTSQIVKLTPEEIYQDILFNLKCFVNFPNTSSATGLLQMLNAPGIERLLEGMSKNPNVKELLENAKESLKDYCNSRSQTSKEADYQNIAADFEQIWQG